LLVVGSYPFLRLWYFPVRLAERATFRVRTGIGQLLSLIYADGEISVGELNSAQLFLALRAHPMQMPQALQPDDTLVSTSVTLPGTERVSQC
jgi:hypothetical protein